MLNYLMGRKIINYEYDMFSCAITILSYISGKYLNYNKFIVYDSKQNVKSVSYDAYKLEFTKRYYSLFSSIEMLLGPNYVYILKKMLYFDDKTNFINFDLPNKITPMELYNIFPNVSELNRLRRKYQLEEQCSISPSLIEMSRLSNTLEKRQKQSIQNILLYKEMKNSVIEIMADICLGHSCLHLFQHSVNMFNRFVNTISIDIGIEINSLTRYGLSCLLICNFIFQSISNNQLNDLKYASRLIGNLYTDVQILDSIICICERLNWELYPKKSLLDWNMDLDENWLSIFYIPKTLFTEERYDQLIANIDNHIENYVIRYETNNVLSSIIMKI
jgi:hypothetical protein